MNRKAKMHKNLTVGGTCVALDNCYKTLSPGKYLLRMKKYDCYNQGVNKTCGIYQSIYPAQ